MKVSEFKPGQVVRLTASQTTNWAAERPPVGEVVRIVGQSSTFTTANRSSGRQALLLTGSEGEEASPEEREAFQKAVERSAANAPINTKSGFTTGSDPEVFLIGPTREVLPAYEVLPDKKQGRGVFWDGFQAEFVVTPGTCHAHFVDYIRSGMQSVLAEARKKEPKAHLTCATVMEIPEKMLLEGPKEGVELGCAPSENAYGKQEHLQGLDPRQLPFRFAGCHLHFGVGRIEQSMAERIIKACDKIAGVVSVLVLKGMEDHRRRMFYGQAGEYRLPAHGIEWRTLSSAILAHPALVHLLADLARAACTMGMSGTSERWKADDAEVQEAINNLNYDAASQIVTRNQDLLNQIMGSMYNEGNVLKSRRIIAEGAINLFPVGDMERNWELHKDGIWTGHSNGDRATFSATKLVA